MSHCEDCNYYYDGICEHEDHMIGVYGSDECCEDYEDFDTYWNNLDDIEREEYNRQMEIDDAGI